MNLINTNYAVAKGPSFGAKLKLTNHNSEIGKKEIEILNQYASRIGTDEDTIEIRVDEYGEYNDWARGNGSLDGTPTCTGTPVSIKAEIGGKTMEGVDKIVQDYNVFSSTLLPYFAKLQLKTSPVPATEIPNKIESLKKDLGTTEKDAKNLETQVQNAKKAYEEAVAAKNAADAKKQVIGDEIARLEERQKGYQDLMNK